MPPRSRSQAQAGDKDLPPVPTTAQEQQRSLTEQDPKAQKKAEEVLKDKQEGASTSQPAGGYTKAPRAEGEPQMRSSDPTTAEQGIQAPTSHVQVTESKSEAGDADPDNTKGPAGSEVLKKVVPAQYDVNDEDVLPPQSL